ncbi:hypothetical protein WOLCODRAFT_147258 [Wolfiporia cocos MD-104 SS10]|uniref:Uncharacterized protein n=1 Tax=Wolfiporia cocos (strain MD-104) TaxID=742152 RepID=A0A2H3J672_WOLCO|nr:hypothetical protein WOLCODRAFT_147258 [Wolfiporia cocos MD-104 SS10]
MPKDTSCGIGKYVLAKHDPTGRTERWEVPSPLPPHIAAVGKPIRKSRKGTKPYKPRDRSPGELAELSAEMQEYHKQCTELNKLMAQRREIEKKLAAKRRALKTVPLEQRLSSPVQGPSVPDNHHILDQSLKFGKTIYLRAAEHIRSTLLATLTRLTPLYNKGRNYANYDAYYDIKFDQMVIQLDDLLEHLRERARSGRITRKMWRVMKKDCNRIGRVSLERMDQRMAEIIKELAELKISFEYGVPEPEKVAGSSTVTTGYAEVIAIQPKYAQA